MTRVPQWTGFARKTLWDWLQLLIVPAILIVATFVWSASQTRSDNKREDRRIAADRAAAEEARRDATLQGYLDQMSGLMLDRKLLTSKRNDAVRAVARTVTLTALRRLDGGRKGAVVRFLKEARLIDAKTAVGLNDADLSSAELTFADLTFAKTAVVTLNDADLSGADLTFAVLRDVNFRNVNFRDANLTGATLTRANFEGANLKLADLEDANLEDANLEDANLEGANLEGANLEGANLEVARLRGASLRSARLLAANLKLADLEDAVLEGAVFGDPLLEGVGVEDANLDSADLEGADLEGAKGLDLDHFLTLLATPENRKEFLDAQEAFLDSLSREELSEFNLSPEELARIRREASGG